MTRAYWAGKSSPVSVDINQEMLEALETLYNCSPTPSIALSHNSYVLAREHAARVWKKAKTAISKASPPKQNEK